MKKRIIAMALGLTCLLPAVGAANAAPAQRASITIGPEHFVSQTPAQQTVIAAFTGTVTRFERMVMEDGRTPIEGAWTVQVQGEDGREMVFVVTKDSYRLTEQKGRVGSRITVWYDASAAMTFIYPERHSALVLYIGGEAQSLQMKTDWFDDELLSDDGELKLNIGPDTVIVDKDGKPYTGSLARRRLVVSYAVATLSLPAQTTPVRIVVLGEGSTGAGEKPLPLSAKLIVKGKEVKAAPSYLNAQGVVMVPLRAVAEEIGFEVNYYAESKTMTLGLVARVQVGVDSYAFGYRAPATLGTAPELIDGEVYVPLSYYTTVLRLGDAYVRDGRIVIGS